MTLEFVALFFREVGQAVVALYATDAVFYRPMRWRRVAQLGSGSITLTGSPL
jgi:hypothetical protein